MRRRPGPCSWIAPLVRPGSGYGRERGLHRGLRGQDEKDPSQVRLRFRELGKAPAPQKLNVEDLLPDPVDAQGTDSLSGPAVQHPDAEEPLFDPAQQGKVAEQVGLTLWRKAHEGQGASKGQAASEA